MLRPIPRTGKTGKTVFNSLFFVQSVYNRMLTYLQERGISNDFAEELIDLATAIENHEYIGSLEKLQKFVSSK